MNMSSTNLDNLIVKFPQDRETIQRLVGFFSGTNTGKEFTLQRLYDLAAPSTTFAFAQLLNQLVEIGIMRRIVRVESPSLGGINDFSSITEVPEEIFDWRQDITIEVKPENIRVLYKVVSI